MTLIPSGLLSAFVSDSSRFGFLFKLVSSDSAPV